MRRFQYNPRLLDLVRRIPRGTIVDRNGLRDGDRRSRGRPAGRAAYAKVGVSIGSTVHASRTRGVIHLAVAPFIFSATPRRGATGVRRIRRLSSATASPALEGLRRSPGDRQRCSIADGAKTTAVRRDYRDLVPVFRHRFDPDHPAVKAAMNPHRRAALTIDARLQARAAAIVSTYARRSSSGRAAAVVIDPATGDLLASVSYPWPADAMRDEEVRRMRGATTTRCSIVRATACIHQDRLSNCSRRPLRSGAMPASAAQTFTCSRLPDDRVGVQASGLHAPDSRRCPGQTAAWHDRYASCAGRVVQCVLRAVSGEARAAGAARRGAAGRDLARAKQRRVSHPRHASAGRLRPGRSAWPRRCAWPRLRQRSQPTATFATCGVRAMDAKPRRAPVSSAEIARTLGGYMRDVVLDGTGRSVKSNSVAIAGKTGTAEVTGAPSHSWFIGFAPYGAASASRGRCRHSRERGVWRSGRCTSGG